MSSGRVFHITAPKCGSQWVRDVLSASEVARYSGYPLFSQVIDLDLDTYVDVPPQTFCGPIYWMNAQEWNSWRTPGDKAIVVLRDPRDSLVSLMFSVLYSHAGGVARVDFRREELMAKQNDNQRIEHLIFNEVRYQLRLYRTWNTVTRDDALIVKYEALIADQHAEFRRVMSWLAWKVPGDVIDAVVNRLSFETRSGRRVGETDNFSHYRRGIPGDWRNHFTRNHGRFWEQCYPGFLKFIGYEDSNDWWESLPLDRADCIASMDTAEPAPSTGGLVDALMRRNRLLEKELADKESQIHMLKDACDERLKLIEKMDAELKAIHRERTKN